MIRITTLIENSPGEHPALLNEHGLSFCIETDDHKILFDTGQSGAFLKNAEVLRINPGELDYVVISHGHYDHSGGLRSLMERNERFELIVGKGFFGEKYAELKGGGHKFIGNNVTREYLDEHRIGFSENDSPLWEFVPGIYVLGHFPRIHSDELISPRFKLLKDGQFVPDRFDDEILLVIDTREGLVVLLGCSHPGMRNLLDAVRKRFKKPIHAVMGGTHLVEASPRAADAALDYFKQESIPLIGLCHCTGERGMNIISQLKESFFYNRTGSTLIIP